MQSCPWYNTKISSQLNGQNFEDFSKQNASTSINLCVMHMHMTKIIHQVLIVKLVAVEDHLQLHNLKNNLNNLVKLSNFIDNLLQCFEVNYDEGINLCKQNMSELFNNIPLSLPPKNIYDKK